MLICWWVHETSHHLKRVKMRPDFRDIFVMDALFLTSSGLKLSELDASVDEERLQVKPFSCKEGERMIQRGLHAWGILIGPFAAS